MLKALDGNNCIVLASECDKNKKELYRCRFCDEQMTLKKGEYNKPYFSHLPNSKCVYNDKDNKSPWHIRMQEYFPKEAIEYVFVDSNTNEKHIADVYLENNNTVIEFQKSHISNEEFLKRTFFHTLNGRRIVWIFDESTENVKKGDLGRLRPDSLVNQDILYRHYTFKWLYRPRKCLLVTPKLDMNRNYSDFSVCVYSGVEGDDVVHKIVDEDFDYEYVTISVHNILMRKDMNIEDFFKSEKYWLDQPEGKLLIKAARYEYFRKRGRNK